MRSKNLFIFVLFYQIRSTILTSTVLLHENVLSALPTLSENTFMSITERAAYLSNATKTYNLKQDSFAYDNHV